jgi:hypothetical protein
MKTFKSKSGPFREQPFYKTDEIERMCTSELRETGLYPSAPARIRIERFIEKRFRVTPSYEDLPDGVLGWTRFSASGVDSIIVARSLVDTAGIVAERQVASTLAHEAGHGLLHAHLFVLGLENGSLFPEDADVDPNRILCRDANSPDNSGRRGYDGRWWEVQANMAMAALLLPLGLVQECISPLLTGGALGRGTLAAHRRQQAISRLSEAFGVNPVMARYRLEALFPDNGQLTL